MTKTNFTKEFKEQTVKQVLERGYAGLMPPSD